MHSTHPAIDHLDPKKLRPHEQVRGIKLAYVLIKLLIDRKFTKPVLVDRESLTILDGHHRVRVAILLRCTRIPVYYVDYLKDKEISVQSRRLGVEVTKPDVLAVAKHGHLFLYKTTKHRFHGSVYPQIEVPLWQ